MEKYFFLIKDFLPVITVIISSVLSFFIAKIQAKSEIHQTLLTIKHDDKNTFNTTFERLMAATSNYYHFPDANSLNDAIAANAAFMVIAPVTFHPLLTKMDVALSSNNKEQIQIIREDLLEMLSQKIERSS